MPRGAADPALIVAEKVVGCLLLVIGVCHRRGPASLLIVRVRRIRRANGRCHEALDGLGPLRRRGTSRGGIRTGLQNQYPATGAGETVGDEGPCKAGAYD